jgi:hypothetical protein
MISRKTVAAGVGLAVVLSIVSVYWALRGERGPEMIVGAPLGHEDASRGLASSHVLDEGIPPIDSGGVVSITDNSPLLPQDPEAQLGDERGVVALPAGVTSARNQAVLKLSGEEGAARMYAAHAPLRGASISSPDSKENRVILADMVAKALARSLGERAREPNR